MAETRSHQVLRGRLDYLEQHHETVDAAMHVAEDKVKSTKANSLAAGLGFGTGKYPRLDHPKQQMNRIFNFSRAKNNEGLITQTYTILSEYLRGVLGEVYETKPLQVVGSTPHTLAFHEIVELGNWEAIAEHMVDKVFRSLENERDTKKLIEKVLKKAGASPPKSLGAALKYLSMRHLFVHNSGVADAEYKTAYGDGDLRPGGKLPTDSSTARAALDAIRALAEEVDAELLLVGAVIPRT